MAAPISPIHRHSIFYTAFIVWHPFLCARNHNWTRSAGLKRASSSCVRSNDEPKQPFLNCSASKQCCKRDLPEKIPLRCNVYKIVLGAHRTGTKPGNPVLV